MVSTEYCHFYLTLLNFHLRPKMYVFLFLQVKTLKLIEIKCFIQVSMHLVAMLS